VEEASAEAAGTAVAVATAADAVAVATAADETDVAAADSETADTNLSSLSLFFQASLISFSQHSSFKITTKF